ncbi:ABC transporter permease [Olivibacter sitiensis]|uniref:ABC transporter permease n=1 Tax=Olivibacter sitiensis TaxID=376470 RepID=UPI0003F90126|nr:ABC transporter permease [Olivibacter sitiensis]
MHKIALIIQREYLSRVKKKSFLLTTFLVPLLFIGMYAVVIIMAMNSKAPQTTVDVIDLSGQLAPKLENTSTITFRTLENGNIDIEKRALQDKGAENQCLLIIPSDVLNTQKVELYNTGKQSVAVVSTIESKLNNAIRNILITESGIDVAVLDKIKADVSINSKEMTADGEKDSSSYGAMGVSFFLAILIYITLFIYGSQVMRGIIEEKTSRIVEVIISSVKPFQLMMGKIIGIGLVGLTQFLLWVVLSLALSTVASSLMSKNEAVQMELNSKIDQDGVGAQEEVGSNDKLSVIMKTVKGIDFGYIITVFLIYYLGGYLIYSALFAMVGSAVDNETDTQQFMLPIIMPLLVTYMLSFSVMMNDPQGPVSFWLSMIPFTSPVAMLVRIPFGVPFWQLALSIVLLILGFLGTTYVAARIYRVGILMYGKKPTYKELMKWFTYKA